VSNLPVTWGKLATETNCDQNFAGGFMATAAVKDIGQLIKSDPKIRGGKPCIAGTGVSVHRVSVWHNLGYRPEQIAYEIGHVTEAQVYAALTYYFANKGAIDAEIAEEEAEADKMEREYLAAQQRQP
jgi:uncharacterized protein (DUF433 family)